MRIDSSMRLAAFPVGAARAIASTGTPSRTRARRIESTTEVFPVPGPPETTARGSESAARIADCCSSDRRTGSPFWKVGRARMSASASSIFEAETSSAGAVMRARSDAESRSS